MGLLKYKQKRTFSQTPEPEGKKASARSSGLRFVVQKHDASHLHYDFRLEMEGVLKSWAVPKGPSTDPEVKRLAMMVEDHPYEYRTFEGIIPEGNYGAGTVIVWDEGTYEPIDFEGSKAKMEKELLKQLEEGKLKFVLHGEKLKGEFTLIKTSGRGENSWLLIKHKDEYASSRDITKKDASAQSGRTLEEVARLSDKEWRSGRSTTRRKTTSKRETRQRPERKETSADEADVEAILKKAPEAPFPSSLLKPMLATLTNAAFDAPDWVFEVKWDGYRCVAYCQGKAAELFSRNDLLFTQKFEAVSRELSALKLDAVLDGEIVALDEEGKPSFQQLQNYARKGKAARLVYYVFDLLWYQGRDLQKLPLLERKAVLQQILPPSEVIRYSDHVEGQGKAFFQLALDAGLEGVMAKQRDSNYKTGIRTANWLKVKNVNRLEAIICGYTKPRNSRAYFGAVILGKYENGKLVYIGHSGSGFDTAGLKSMYERFQPLVQKECPFATKPRTNMPVTWLEPYLVCEVKFAEWTEDQVLRQPIFLGLREDKTAMNEKKEKLVPAPGTATAKKKTARPAAEKAAPSKSKKKAVSEAGTPQAPGSSRGTASVFGGQKELVEKIGKHTLTFTNLDKIYFPQQKISKGNVLNYYDSVSEYIMPYLKDRPHSLNRHPNGIGKPNFYQKNVEGKVADWIPTHFYDSESSEDLHYLVCTEPAVLMYMANLGCIEMNPWHSRVKSEEFPDWCVIDLDPDGNPFSQVMETALVVKEVLDSVKAEAYCKTSGATGIHIYIPLGAQYSFDDSRTLAELIVLMVNRELPGFTSVERAPSKRKGKIYLDFLQNRKIQTIAAPYSLRPVPDASVSMPLSWDELKGKLSPKDFTIFNALERIREVEKDKLFRPVLGKGIDLEKVLERMQALSQ